VTAISAQSAAGREARIAAVRRSPELANAHDRAGWLGLYSDDATVEDPVGTPPCRRGAFTRGGREDDLELFYRTFIAPTSLRAEAIRDVVVGDKVVREVVLHTRLPGGARASIPAFLEYDLVAAGSGFRVRHLRAYWDTSRAGREVNAQGLRGKLTSVLSGLRLLRHFGRDWTARYAKGSQRGIKRDGAPKVAALQKAIASGDRAAFDAVATARATVTLPGGAPSPLRDLPASLGLTFETPICSGLEAIGTCRATDAGRDVVGVAVTSFDAASKQITAVRLLWEPPAAGA
jgi:ketosteroid isomerase-like protein